MKFFRGLLIIAPISLIIWVVIIYSIVVYSKKDHTIELPKEITEMELMSCEGKNPEYFSMLVIENDKIYWTTKEGKKVVCVKVR